MTENTHDLSKFGRTELREAAKLLDAYRNTLPNYLYCGISIEFNPNSGRVFIVDDDYNVAMLNNDQLEQWHNCPECGNEGFLEDIISDGNECCHVWLMDAGLADEIDILKSKVTPGETSSGSILMTDIVDGVANLLPNDLVDAWDMCDENDPDDVEMGYIYDEICEHLDDIAPDGYIFGSSDGDGASYGFWKVDDDDPLNTEV